MTINETIAEVLRLDAEATQGPWEWSPPSRGSCGGFPGVCTFGRDAVYAQAYGDPPDPEDAALIAYYRAAAPALAREVQDLRERHRLTLQERDRAQADARRIVAVREELAALLGTEDIAEAVAEVKRLQALAEVRAVGCACGDDDACMFVRQRDAAHKHGQEAMRERARGACRAARREYGSILSALGDAYAWGWQDALDRAESAIRALEVQP